MLKTKKSLVIFCIVLILILAGAFALLKFKKSDVKNEVSKQGEMIKGKNWSVVYLSSGEIYVARLSYPVSLSSLSLPADSYMLQIVKGKDENGQDKSNFQLTPLNEFLWAPNDLFVNRDQVIFYGPIKEDSGVGKAIKDAGKWDEAGTSQE
ncbi:MAG: hypothetical protein ABIC82_04105 [bacterium]